MTSILMWLGRLELLTVLILIHPRTWSDEKTGELTVLRTIFTDVLNKFRR